MGRKLIFSFIAVSLIVALCSALSYGFMRQTQRAYDRLAERQNEMTERLSAILTGTERQMGLLFRYLAEPGEEPEKEMREANAQLSADIAALARESAGYGSAVDVGKLGDSNQTFARLVEKVVGYVREGKPDIARSEAGQWAVPTSEDLARQALEIKKAESGEQQAAMDANRNRVRLFNAVLVAVSAAAVLLAIAIGWALSRMIVKPAKSLVAAASRIAEGDLSGADVAVKGRDELHSLADAFNAMKANLRLVIRQAVSNSEQVAAASVRLRANSDRVAGLSEQVTAVMQQIAAGSEKQQLHMGQGSERIGRMALSTAALEESAVAVQACVERAGAAAGEGRLAIERAAGQMQAIRSGISRVAEATERLSRHAGQIERMAALIVSIARQTNLLALNASIEASRAGEHGKGFAVVAEEVRKLSGQTGQAAEEVAAVVAGIRAEMADASAASAMGDREAEAGIAVVSRAAEAFARIEESIGQVAERMKENAVRSADMALHSREAAEAMDLVREVTDATSAGARGVMSDVESQHEAIQEIAAAAAMLTEEAERLLQRISHFRVADERRTAG
ncbi:methyl-accepting chemotaxis protein [Cohnella thermotolerans]|uniref:methyl-accepting chemotaxis protein n=1 Tax=Cohnella thermotolerans TaxID=329858 RepID=UPI0004090D59|nr:methyl-accepting chemotaxis protein [Cohnella thermotolerans]